MDGQLPESAIIAKIYMVMICGVTLTTKLEFSVNLPLHVDKLRIDVFAALERHPEEFGDVSRLFVDFGSAILSLLGDELVAMLLPLFNVSLVRPLLLLDPTRRLRDNIEWWRGDGRILRGSRWGSCRRAC